MKILKIFVLLSFAITNIDGAKILGLFILPSRSHLSLGEKLLKRLANDGHEVTITTPFRTKNLPRNYKELLLPNVLKVKDDNVSKMMLNQQNQSFIGKLLTFSSYLNLIEETFFNEFEIQELIKSKKRYDLAIVVWFGNDAILALAEHVANYTIIFNPVGSLYSVTKLTKAPASPSYVPSLFPPFPDRMSMVERLLNFLVSIGYGLFDYMVDYNQRLVINKYLPNSRSIDKIYEHVSLVLLNTHHSLESPRLYVPQMIQVGGLHIEEPKKLSNELKTIMDQAEEGAILFSMGSNIQSSDLGENKLQEIIRCFSKLPYKVLWKFEKQISNLPKNVLISKWLPQQDLLAHKNMKLFITHGGLLSTTEAVFYGVPMVAIPVFGDQEANTIESVMKGYAVRVSYSDLSEKTLNSAIEEVINNPKYRNNIQIRSRVFRDEPMKPLDKAVFWVEYVIRHDGAHHLKTSAFKLHWLQQYLIDVIAVIFGIVFGCLYVICKMFNGLRNCILKRRTLKNNKKRLNKSKES
ncbi:hypothetical protein FQR65_LT00800 [Abscondita terminalis]|nr:hypothetical protein FQR65_LT00800 [Abscondita terminalis]